MKNIIYICFYLFTISVSSQGIVKDTIIDDLLIIRGDSLVLTLDEVIVFKNRKFKSASERKYYYWYAKKVRKAYPYAKMASEKLSEINKELVGIKSKRKRKKHIKKIQRFMEGEFTNQLKKLTKTEGRILIKLIHRQTGETMFELIKEYRSRWNAFWYNSTANLFKLSLKSQYHPETEALDYIIEDILQRSFAKGVLVKQEPKLPVDYFGLMIQWENIDLKREINAYIEKYK
ncbi:MAG: DUF4294 domain-containing protein [Flavobacteriaceae bacterium]|nr:DUF4294 domain-containing protein [Flavobacteriaceae bacterium]